MFKTYYNSDGTDSSIGGNSSHDVVALNASTSDSSTSIQNGRILIASKVAIDEMPSYACSDKQVDS
ncbi:MAG: hypothetical protein Q4C05_09065, partial [Akkermansia sp.]|nr:hypothetical protein [Akkermansia sp.]